MKRNEIKQFKRDLALRPLRNFIKDYWYEAGRTLVGSFLFIGTAYVVYVGTWAVFN